MVNGQKRKVGEDKTAVPLLSPPSFQSQRSESNPPAVGTRTGGYGKGQTRHPISSSILGAMKQAVNTAAVTERQQANNDC